MKKDSEYYNRVMDAVAHAMNSYDHVTEAAEKYSVDTHSIRWIIKKYNIPYKQHCIERKRKAIELAEKVGPTKAARLLGIEIPRMRHMWRAAGKATSRATGKANRANYQVIIKDTVYETCIANKGLAPATAIAKALGVSRSTVCSHWFREERRRKTGKPYIPRLSAAKAELKPMIIDPDFEKTCLLNRRTHPGWVIAKNLGVSYHRVAKVFYKHDREERRKKEITEQKGPTA